MNKPMLESWKNKINVVEAVRGGMSDDAKVTLAKVLNNTNNALADMRAIKNEACCSHNLGCNTPSSQYSGIDWFPEHSIDMVSTIYASQIIDDLVSVQSIDSPIGMIRFIEYTYGTNRGNVARGGVAIDRWGAMAGVADGNHVACELIKEETIGQGAASTGAITDKFLQQLPIKFDAENPVVITDGVNFRVRVNKTASGLEYKDIDVDGNETGTHVGMSNFTLDPESGAITLTDASLADAAVMVSYFQDLSHAPTDSMNLEVRVRTEMVRAVPHKIRANFSFDASYALSKAHGINIEESLVNACTAEIRQERDNEVINLLMKQASVKNRTWDRQVTSYISQHEHDMSFLSEIFACASLINQQTKRGFGNWVVVGRQGLNIIKSAGSDHFKATGATLPNNGAFVVGEIEGQIKVIYSPYVPENSYLVGYKGTDMDAGFVVADFLPITKTELVMLDDFVGRQGLVSYYGTKMLNPKMYVAGTIVNGN